MVTKTQSATLDGIQGILIQIEALSLNALPQIHITGLPGEVVKESKERVSACLVNLGFDIPTSKILVHLSPANIKKMGSHYDLPITLAVLAAEKRMLGVNLEEWGFLGELSLDGQLCRMRGALPLIQALVESPNIRGIIIPKGNEFEGALLKSTKIFLAGDLGETIDFLKTGKPLSQCRTSISCGNLSNHQSFDEVLGQSLAKRALQISIAGHHHLLLSGPPGIGKTMLSASAPALLPEMTHQEFVDVLKIYSVSSVEIDDMIEKRSRPYRSPHHTISANGLLGGGAGGVVPGEASLSHHGVLFLDEFPEFRRDAIEGLREPLQSGWIHLSRVGRTVSLPAGFTLIAAMNPCPCGLYSPIENRCRCTPEKKAQYRRKLSSPILDRMGLMVQMNSSISDCGEGVCGLTYQKVKESIQSTFEIQNRRCKAKWGTSGDPGREISLQDPDFRLDERSEVWLKERQKEQRLSYRRVGQVIRVARTISDLGHSKSISMDHLREAWSLRCFDFYPIS